MAAQSSVKYTSKTIRKKRPIVFTLGDKGGTGKSFAARVLAGWLRRHAYTIVGYDGDGRNGHLSRYYEASASVSREKLRSPEGWSNMLASWENVADDTVILIDLPGNIGDMVEDETQRITLLANALDRELIGVWVASEEEDSIWLLQPALNLVPARQMLFLMNGRFGADPSKFELWNESETRHYFLSDEGTEAYLPVLPIRPRVKIARARSPFNDVSSAGLGSLERIDFDIWWAGVETAFKPLTAMLGGRS